MKWKLLLASTFIIFTLHSQAQLKDSIVSGTLLYPHIGVNMPGADLAARFGNSMDVGFGISHKTNKNLLFGARAGFIFGNTVKEDSILDLIKHDNGFIYGLEGIPTEVFFFERGFMLEINAGKIFDVIGPNRNSGIYTGFGLGILQHKIRIQIDQNFSENDSPQLNDQLKKGYDRLSNGPYISGQLYYLNLSNDKLVNFFFGAEIVTAFTKNRRSWNFDTFGPDPSSRLDMMFSLKFGWILPIYSGVKEHEY